MSQGVPMNSDLSLDFLRVVEQAAIACAHTMGQGDADKADHAAVEAMRGSLDTVMIDGTIVIGEGERDKAPMLYIGEKVGLGAKGKLPWGALPVRVLCFLHHAFTAPPVQAGSSQRVGRS